MEYKIDVFLFLSKQLLHFKKDIKASVCRGQTAQLVVLVATKTSYEQGAAPFHSSTSYSSGCLPRCTQFIKILPGQRDVHKRQKDTCRGAHPARGQAVKQGERSRCCRECGIKFGQASLLTWACLNLPLLPPSLFPFPFSHPRQDIRRNSIKTRIYFALTHTETEELSRFCAYCAYAACVSQVSSQHL